MRLVGKTPVEAAGIDTTGWKSLLEESGSLWIRI